MYPALMIRWERLSALIAPAVVIAALVCLVRGASMFGERWGWLAGFVSLLFVAYAVDRGGEQAQPADVQNIAALNGQTQRIGAIR